MTKVSFLRRLRWRLRFALPGQMVEPLVAPYALYFDQGEALGKEEAELVAECGSVALVTTEILEAPAPNRVRWLTLRLLALTVIWVVLYCIGAAEQMHIAVIPRLFQMIGTALGYPLLVVLGTAAAFALLGGKRLLLVQKESTGRLLVWYIINVIIGVGLLCFITFGIMQPVLDAIGKGLYWGLAHFDTRNIGPTVTTLCILHAILTGTMLVWTGARAAHFGGVYLPLLCVNAGALVAGGQLWGSLRTLADVAVASLALLQIGNTVWFGFGLALLVGLMVLLTRRLKWLRS